MKNIKSPLNYTGGKFKMLDTIKYLAPANISMLYDIFGGGGNISLNISSKYVYYNEIVPYVTNILEGVKSAKNIDTLLSKIDSIIEEFGLSRTNKIGFEELRYKYNTEELSWEYLYTLMCYSFNYQFRFNNQHKYNSSFGKNRSSFSVNMRNRLESLDITFDSLDFRKVDLSDADENDLVYVDPPYLISTGNYNDGKRGFKGWSEKDERDLLDILDKLHKQGGRFMLSNVTHHKGLKNNILIEWAKKYNSIKISKDYKNCSYQVKT